MVTLKDVAKAAGVSPGTVSFVMNNTHEKRRISAATAENVRRIARELGYIPNIAARNLRSVDPMNRQLVLAILTSSDGALALVSHLLEALKLKKQGNTALNFLVNIAMFKPGELRDLPGLLDGQRFNAAIITNTTKQDDEFLMQATLPYPCLVVGRDIPNYSSFVPSRNAGKVAFDALYKAGARKLAVIHPCALTQLTETRVEQFSQLAEKKLGVPPVRLVCSDQSKEAASRTLNSYLIKGGMLDGLFAVHDNLAVGVYPVLKDAGLSIPEKVKVVGIGDSEWAPYLDPPLSCAGAEEQHVYMKAVDMLFESLNAEQAEPVVAGTNARFVSRGST